MLTEPKVIAAVCQELGSQGYQIKQRLGPRETGDDIIAARQELVPCQFHIEAKGGTSSQEGSRRFGQPFTNAQIRVHVAQALYKAAEILSRAESSVQTRVGIALPDTARHRTVVQKIQPVLTQLGVALFWVHEDKSVQIVPADPI
jgi:hypothetical protein